jgi:hypothetical protein
MVSVRTGIGDEPHAGRKTDADSMPRSFCAVMKCNVPAKTITVPAMVAHKPMDRVRNPGMTSRLSERAQVIAARLHRPRVTAPHGAVTEQFLLPHGNNPSGLNRADPLDLSNHCCHCTHAPGVAADQLTGLVSAH